MSVDLRSVIPGGRPKGFVPYRPRAAKALHVRRILDVYERMLFADALPTGPRQCGYRLKEWHPGEYVKADFPMINDVITRLLQARKLPWAWVANASRVDLDPGGYEGIGDYLRNLPTYERDLRQRQPVVVEIYAEARETLPLIQRVAHERGVKVYSETGSSGPGLAVRVASRAVARARDHGQATRLFGICDLDQPGIKNVLRPHIEHAAAFLYATDPKADCALVGGNDANVSFDHLALTPQQALDHNLVEQNADRERLHAYIASGTHVWDRDLHLLDGVQKIETEALDPILLRNLVVEAIDSIIDADVLTAVRAEGTREADWLEKQLGRISATGLPFKVDP